jgi:hypothetical protein
LAEAEPPFDPIGVDKPSRNEVHAAQPDRGKALSFYQVANAALADPEGLRRRLD